MAELQMSYAKALASVKMAVYAEETPVQTLPKDHLTWISEALLDANISEGQVKAKFEAVQTRRIDRA